MSDVSREALIAELRKMVTDVWSKPLREWPVLLEERLDALLAATNADGERLVYLADELHQVGYSWRLLAGRRQFTESAPTNVPGPPGPPTVPVYRIVRSQGVLDARSSTAANLRAFLADVPLGDR